MFQANYQENQKYKDCYFMLAILQHIKLDQYCK